MRQGSLIESTDQTASDMFAYPGGALSFVRLSLAIAGAGAGAREAQAQSISDSQPGV